MRDYTDETEMPHNSKPLLDPPEFPQVIPENITNQQIYVMLLSLHSQQAISTKAINQVHYEQVRDRQERADMVETWKTAKNVLKFIYILGAIGGSILAMVGVTKIWSGS